MRKHRNQVERRAEVRAWRASGLSARGYCAAHGLTKGSLARWAAEVDAGEPPVSFVRLQVAQSPAPSLSIEVGVARVTVARRFDPTLLREVVQALSAERS